MPGGRAAPCKRSCCVSKPVAGAVGRRRAPGPRSWRTLQPAAAAITATCPVPASQIPADSPGCRCDDRPVITGDDVGILLFDVLGTVVDEAGSMRAELVAALDQVGVARRQGEALAAAWQQRFAALVASIHQGAAWRSTDELNAEALAGVLRNGPRLPEATARHLALAGHRLKPWPDAQAALRSLAQRFTIVALSNGNLSMLTDLFAGAGLSWHAVLSGEMVHAYKPDPAVYQLALNRLALDPRRTLMVAAHPWGPARCRGPWAEHRLYPASG